MTSAELRAAIRALCPSATRSQVLALEGLIARSAEAIAHPPYRVPWGMGPYAKREKSGE